MGPYNPRNTVHGNVSNSGLNNKPGGPNRSMGPQPFINNPNQFVPMQNNQMGFPMSGPVMFPGQSFPGFLPQFNVPNMNNSTVFPTNSPFGMPAFNQMNPAQFQNMPNFAQLMSLNMGMSNGQLGMQNMNQLNALQMANLAQLGAFNMPASHQMLGSLNQVNPGRDPQNPAFFGAPLYGAAGSADGRGNQMNLAQPSIEQELPHAPEQPESNSPPPGFSHLAREGQAQEAVQSFHDNSVKNGQSSMSNSWKHTPNKNFQDRSRNGRWENPKFMPAKNSKRKFNGFRDNENRGGFNGSQRHNNKASSSNEDSPQVKRSIPLNYSEQEVQQWREQRRKNHPSRSNKDELHKGKLTGDENIEREERLRREQLKEILAKQVELGVEVADIPAHYLLEPEKQEETISKSDLSVKEKSRNRRNKQGKIKSKHKFPKRQNIANNEPSMGPPSTTREPTLLQKLLGADIRREKHHLLQAFRFLAMNNLLKDRSDKPLEYPTVLVKDADCATITSASHPGILASEDLAGKDRDHDLHCESNVLKGNFAVEPIPAEEDGEFSG